MKKLTTGILSVLMLLSSTTMQLTAGTKTENAPVTTTKNVEAARLAASVARVNEIKAMDKSKLSSDERKSLRKELRVIKKDIKDNDNKGIYLSVGAIIIIILLLILLL
jgi:hypothetical protein